jgi:hypothetical protein
MLGYGGMWGGMGMAWFGLIRLRSGSPHRSNTSGARWPTPHARLTIVVQCRNNETGRCDFPMPLQLSRLS